jgi:hypothetical protein
MLSAASGFIFVDMLIRPFCKLGIKFPVVGLIFMTILYGSIGYLVLKSAYNDY